MSNLQPPKHKDLSSVRFFISKINWIQGFFMHVCSCVLSSESCREFWKLWAAGINPLPNLHMETKRLHLKWNQRFKHFTTSDCDYFSSGQLYFSSLLTTHTSAESPRSLSSTGQEWTPDDFYYVACGVLARLQLEMIELGHAFCPGMVWSWTALVLGTNQYCLQPNKPS